MTEVFETKNVPVLFRDQPTGLTGPVRLAKYSWESSPTWQINPGFITSPLYTQIQETIRTQYNISNNFSIELKNNTDYSNFINFDTFPRSSPAINPPINLSAINLSGTITPSNAENSIFGEPFENDEEVIVIDNNPHYVFKIAYLQQHFNARHAQNRPLTNPNTNEIITNPQTQLSKKKVVLASGGKRTKKSKRSKRSKRTAKKYIKRRKLTRRHK
jgi:hypothetical protein